LAQKEHSMCDYSLHTTQNRLAIDGETLVVHRFNTGTIGLAPVPSAEASPEKPKLGFWRRLFAFEPNAGVQQPCAVCVPPGARLLMRDIPVRLQATLGVSECEEVRFTQITARENTHRDAVQFANGITLLLQRLEPGQHVEILDLGIAEETPDQVSADDLREEVLV
jgi:hypothetical protein